MRLTSHIVSYATYVAYDSRLKCERLGANVTYLSYVAFTSNANATDLRRNSLVGCCNCNVSCIIYYIIIGTYIDNYV